MSEVSITVDEDTTVHVAFGNTGHVATVNLNNGIYKNIEPTSSANLSGLLTVGGDQVHTRKVTPERFSGYALGDRAFGGIVYGHSTGQYGAYLLIVSLFDEGDSTQVGNRDMVGGFKWCANSVGNGVFVDSHTDGLYNTYQILKGGMYSKVESIFEWLDSYVQGLNGYNDWYIPAHDELNAIYQNRDHLDNYSTTRSYWSSTEYSSTYVGTQYIDCGYQYTGLKASYGRYVRAVRREFIHL